MAQILFYQSLDVRTVGTSSDINLLSPPTKQPSIYHLFSRNLPGGKQLQSFLPPICCSTDFSPSLFRRKEPQKSSFFTLTVRSPFSPVRQPTGNNTAASPPKLFPHGPRKNRKASFLPSTLPSAPPPRDVTSTLRELLNTVGGRRAQLQETDFCFPCHSPSPFYLCLPAAPLGESNSPKGTQPEGGSLPRTFVKAGIVENLPSPSSAVNSVEAIACKVEGGGGTGGERETFPFVRTTAFSPSPSPFFPDRCLFALGLISPPFLPAPPGPVE